MLESRSQSPPRPVRLLFVCGRARRRSATAETLFGGVRGFEAAAAGVAPDADVPLDADAIDWADVILAMQNAHRAKINRKFGPQIRGKKLVVLGIADDYDYMDAALVRLLWDRVPRSVAGLRPVD